MTFKKCLVPKKLQKKGCFEDGTIANVFLLKNGVIGLTDAPHWRSDTGRFLTIPPERIFNNKTGEFFFRLLNRRKWYLYWNGQIYKAKWSP